MLYTKVPTTQHACEQYANALRAKEILEIPFTSRNLSSGFVLEVEYLRGLCGVHFVDVLKTEPNKVIPELARALKVIHAHKGEGFSENLIDPGHLKFSHILIQRISKLLNMHNLHGHERQTYGKALSSLVWDQDYDDLRPSLVHFDLHAGNLIWDGTKVHVLDYENARLYDSLWDLMMLKKYLLEDEQAWSLFVKHYYAGAGKPDYFSDRLKLYEIIDALWEIHPAHLLSRSGRAKNF